LNKVQLIVFIVHTRLELEITTVTQGVSSKWSSWSVSNSHGVNSSVIYLLKEEVKIDSFTMISTTNLFFFFFSFFDNFFVLFISKHDTRRTD
jgi:hypothetical protein